MQLYEKIQVGKTTRYREYVPEPRKTRVEMELDNAEVCSIVASIGICCLYGMEQHLPEHSVIARRTTALEKAIGDVAALNAGKLSERHLEAATQAWSAAMITLQSELQAGEA